MNPFDDNEIVPESEPFQPSANSEETHFSAENSTQNHTAYPGNGAGKAESPYVNSPYATQYNRYQSQNPGGFSYQYQPPQYQPPKKKAGGHSFWKKAVAAILTIALVAGGCCITAFTVNSQWEKRNQENMDYLNQQIKDLQKKIDSASVPGSPVVGNPVSSEDYLTPGQVYTQNVDSVVAISSTIRTTAYGRVTEGTATGSGFILTENGFVATNYHVIEGATAISVITYSGEEYTARTVGHDSSLDLAVLKIEAEDLPAVTLGSSTELSIGDMVVAIGNPLGDLTATQTVGYVSGKNREVSTDSTSISMIQTDAAINPGNSGGPLFNMKGEVVGITTAKYSGTTSSGASIEGIGFAIPMDDIANIINDLKDLGYVTGAYLGVTVKDTDAESAALYGLPTGAYVVTVVEGGSADRAGVQPKDIIISLGDYTVGSVTELTRALRNFKADATTTITIIRSGQQVELEITLDERPQDLNSDTGTTEDEQLPGNGSYDEWFDYFRRYFEGQNHG